MAARFKIQSKISETTWLSKNGRKFQNQVQDVEKHSKKFREIKTTWSKFQNDGNHIKDSGKNSKRRKPKPKGRKPGKKIYGDKYYVILNTIW